MRDSPKDTGFLERAKKTCVKFKRDVNRRRKLIEILLLVGTITAVFDKSAYMMAIFIVFFLVSILFYILLEDEKEHFFVLYICSIFISITFVGILLVNLVINIPEAYRGYLNSFVVIGIMFIFAYVYILFHALSPSR